MALFEDTVTPRGPSVAELERRIAELERENAELREENARMRSSANTEAKLLANIGVEATKRQIGEEEFRRLFGDLEF